MTKASGLHFIFLKRAKKLWVYDILAVIMMLPLFGIPIYQGYLVYKGVMSETERLSPIFDYIFFLDIIPFGIGFAWFAYRYAFYLVPRYPVLRSKKMRSTLIIGVPCCVLFVIYFFQRLWS